MDGFDDFDTQVQSDEQYYRDEDVAMYDDENYDDVFDCDDSDVFF